MHHIAAYYMQLGLKPEDLDKPFIGVCNSYIDIIPGHKHLNNFGEIVKRSDS